MNAIILHRAIHVTGKTFLRFSLELRYVDNNVPDILRAEELMPHLAHPTGWFSS
jgi:hypothetical protein